MKAKEKTSVGLAATLLVVAWIGFYFEMSAYYGSSFSLWGFAWKLVAICATSGLVIRILLELGSLNPGLWCLISMLGFIFALCFLFGETSTIVGFIAYAAGLIAAQGVIWLGGLLAPEGSSASIAGRASGG